MMFKFKNLISILITIILTISFSILSFAADDEEEPDVPAGTPVINIVNGTVFDIEAGRTNKIELRLRNTSGSAASSVVVMPSVAEVEGNPLSLSIEGSSNNIGKISANGERTITLVVEADRSAATKTYGVNIKFTYFNADNVNFDSSSTIYLRLKNTSSKPVFKFDNFKLEPSSLSAGDTANISFELINQGPLNMYDTVVSLENLDPAAVGVKGTNQKNFSKIFAGTREKLSFGLTTNSSMEDGNYPITIKAVYKDENGTEYTYEEKYFIAVGNGVGESADLRIENLTEPTGVYGVNENFDVSFTLKNYGDGTAENVKITAAEYGEGGNVVPKSNSTYSIKEMAPGQEEKLNFTFAATGNAISRNYTVEFKVEYKMGGKDYTFSQYAGANVSNPEKDNEGEEKKESKPKIIVSEYQSDPVIVMAGQNFDLTMKFLNTHYEKAVKNVKMFLTMVEETSSENDKSGNVFTPVDSSNTFYYDSIPAKGSVEKTMTLYTVPSAQPKTYTLTVNFEYEDESGNEYTSTELLGINVQQVSEIETSEIFIPETSEVGMPISVYFDIYNTGKVDVSNLKVALEGDVDTQNKSVYIGNCSPGDSNYYEGSFSVMIVGTNNVKLKISYDDPSGKTIEDVREYTIEGTEPVPIDDTMYDENGMPMDPNAGVETGMSVKTKAIIGVCIALVILILIAIKVIKAKRAARLIKEDLEAADSIDEMEGKDNNEQL